MKKREQRINRILLKQPVDVQELRKISRLEGGFVSNRIRNRVWPKLLAINRYNVADYTAYIDEHRDDSQVKCDIERSLWNIHHLNSWKENYRERRRKTLSNIIMAILCRNEQLFYYQGFHDLVSIFLLVLEDDHLTFALAECVSRNFVSDYMTSDFEIVSHSMRLIFVIIKAIDPELHNFLVKARVEPYFATSWLITWFAHDLKTLNETARLFDALLSSHPSFAYYLCAAYVLHLKSDIMEEDCDFPSIHNFLVHAPEKKAPFPVEKVIAEADKLVVRIPLKHLKSMCEPYLQELTNNNRIAALSKPDIFATSIDADWTILKNMRIVGGAKGDNQFPVIRFVLDTAASWGWTFSYVDNQVHSSGSKVATTSASDDITLDDNHTNSISRVLSLFFSGYGSKSANGKQMFFCSDSIALSVAALAGALFSYYYITSQK